MIAFSKLDRGFDTDLQDIVFLANRGLISILQLEQVVKDAIPPAGKFDFDSRELQEHLQADAIFYRESKINTLKKL